MCNVRKRSEEICAQLEEKGGEVISSLLTEEAGALPLEVVSKLMRSYLPMVVTRVLKEGKSIADALERAQRDMLMEDLLNNTKFPTLVEKDACKDLLAILAENVFQSAEDQVA